LETNSTWIILDIKSLIHSLVGLCLSLLSITLWSQPCPTTSSLLSSYYESWDIPILAAEQMAGWPNVEIPESLKAEIRVVFAAMFHATETIPEADSIINIYCIHHFPMITQDAYVQLDTSFDWVKGWMMTDSLTTHPVLDSMIRRYDLDAHFLESTGSGYIKASRIINFYPIIDTLLDIEGVVGVQEGGWIGDGSRIYFINGFLQFAARWGDCLSGCTGERTYGFLIQDSCEVIFAGAQTTNPEPPGHPTIYDCNVTTSTNDLHAKDALRIYPNPARDAVVVDPGEEVPGDVHYAIYDMLGRVRVKGILHGREIDISSLEVGAFVVAVQIGGEVKSGKLLKWEK
jgi:hypothetical protein